MIKEAARKANSSDRLFEDIEEFVEDLQELVYHREIAEIYVANKTGYEENENCAVTVIFNGGQTGLMITNLDSINSVRFIELNNLQWED